MKSAKRTRFFLFRFLLRKKRESILIPVARARTYTYLRHARQRIDIFRRVLRRQTALTLPSERGWNELQWERRRYLLAGFSNVAEVHREDKLLRTQAPVGIHIGQSPRVNVHSDIHNHSPVFCNVKGITCPVFIPYLSEHGLRQLRLHHDISRLGPGQEAGSRSVPSVEQLGVLQLALMRHRPFYGLRRADGMLAVLRVHGAHSIYTRWPSRCAQRCVRGHGRLRDSAVHQGAVCGRRGYQRQCHGRSDSSA